MRRLPGFLEAPSSFFYRDGEPVRAEESGDLFQEGMLRVARATGTAERAWPKEAIERPAQPPSWSVRYSRQRSVKSVRVVPSSFRRASSTAPARSLCAPTAR